LCKEKKEDLEENKDVKDGGRKIVENSRDVVEGILKEKNYGTLHDYFWIREVSYKKELILNSSCSFDISCSKKKFTKLSVCSGHGY
jgi:hypothetical protein